MVVDATLTFTTYDAFCEFAARKNSLDDLKLRGLLDVVQLDSSVTTGLSKLFDSLGQRDESVLKSSKKRWRGPTTSSMNHKKKKPLKVGWFYKRRDIIMGWRCRYFKIYPGQVEYFRDEQDVIPRGVIPILGAEIKGPLKCTVNGNHECFSIS